MLEMFMTNFNDLFLAVETKKNILIGGVLL